MQQIVFFLGSWGFGLATAGCMLVVVVGFKYGLNFKPLPTPKEATQPDAQENNNLLHPSSRLSWLETSALKLGEQLFTLSEREQTLICNTMNKTALEINPSLNLL